jgi:predicted O-methyltransferase YrrM
LIDSAAAGARCLHFQGLEADMNRFAFAVLLSLLLVVAYFSTDMPGKQAAADTKVDDDQVRQVINNHYPSRGGMNVPDADAQALYDIIVEHGYKNALEIGTSNGYSGLWIAWALSKTGGKLITVEIDRGRYEEAVAYFRKAGLEDYVDARLGDAHEIVPALAGPFDFVFCDADKNWYENYLKAVLPKLTVGGCFTAHNVSDYSGSGWGRRGRGGFGRGGTNSFLEFARSISNLDTKVLDIRGSAGMSVSYKTADSSQ